RNPLFEPEGSGADRHRAALAQHQLAGDLRWNDSRQAGVAAGKRRDHHWPRFVDGDFYFIAVEDLDVFDFAHRLEVAHARPIVRRFLAAPFDIGFHVLSGQLAAVVEFYPLAQLENVSRWIGLF